MKADQLSQTAAFVAVKFYGMTRMKKFRSLFDDSVVSFYDRLVQTLPAPIRYYHFWLRFKAIRKLYIWSEELLLPGDLLHIVARKWYIQQMAVDLVGRGYEQMIILGAGFDHLGYHFSQEGLSCFEFDAPRMVKRKRRFFSKKYPGQRYPQVSSLHLPDDRIGDLIAATDEIDPHKKTMVVAEGFFDYLDADTVSDCLQEIKGFFKRPPALISTHFALKELPSFHRWVFRKSVKLVREPLQLNASIADFERLLESSGFKVTQRIGSQKIRKDLSRLSDTNLAILNGFYVLQAE